MKIVAADLYWAVEAGLDLIDEDVDHAAVMNQSAFKHQY